MQWDIETRLRGHRALVYWSRGRSKELRAGKLLVNASLVLFFVSSTKKNESWRQVKVR